LIIAHHVIKVVQTQYTTNTNVFSNAQVRPTTQLKAPFKHATIALLLIAASAIVLHVSCAPLNTISMQVPALQVVLMARLPITMSANLVTKGATSATWTSRALNAGHLLG
jgi:hypothetical protein